jgi:hypothetical protein
MVCTVYGQSINTVLWLLQYTTPVLLWNRSLQHFTSTAFHGASTVVLAMYYSNAGVLFESFRTLPLVYCMTLITVLYSSVLQYD